MDGRVLRGILLVLILGLILIAYVFLGWGLSNGLEDDDDGDGYRIELDRRGSS